MKILSFDLETGQGFDVQDGDPVNEGNWITEFGAVLWDVEKQVPLEILSHFVNEGKGQSKDCEEYTGITLEQIETYGRPLHEVLEKFLWLQEQADYLLAHNGTNFDIPLTKLALARCGLPTELKPAIDTRIDVKYPNHIAQRSLVYLMAAHGFINPFPHRAAMDAMTTAKILSHYDIDEVIRVATSEPVKLAAKFDYPKESRLGTELFQQKMKEFNNIKDKIKGLGFTWHSTSKTWILETKKALLEGVEFPCPVNEIK